MSGIMILLFVSLGFLPADAAGCTDRVARPGVGVDSVATDASAGALARSGSFRMGRLFATIPPGQIGARTVTGARSLSVRYRTEAARRGQGRGFVRRSGAVRNAT